MTTGGPDRSREFESCRSVFTAAAAALAVVCVMQPRMIFAESTTVHMVIVFPGGPDVEGEGTRIIGQFLGSVAQQAGVDTNHLAGAYFTSAADAVAYVTAHPDAFIMGSLSFFLANRQAMKLVPLARVVFPEDTEECYRLLVKRGSYASLAELRGKTISGNTLFGDPAFLSRIVFGGRVDAALHFRLKPTTRPLSAVRRVALGSIDGVLLNQVQYRSLAQLPVFEELQVVYQSTPLPPLGFMRAGSRDVGALSDRLVKAVVELPETAAGKEACANFALKGFVPVVQGELDEVIRTYRGEKPEKGE